MKLITCMLKTSHSKNWYFAINIHVKQLKCYFLLADFQDAAGGQKNRDTKGRDIAIKFIIK